MSAMAGNPPMDFAAAQPRPQTGPARLEEDFQRSRIQGGPEVFRVPESGDSLQSDEIERKVAWLVQDIRRRSIERRAGVDRNTFLNTAFDRDAQYVEWDPARKIVLAVPAPRNAVRRTLNLHKPFNRSMESRLTRGQPSYQVTARLRTPNFQDAASLGNALIPAIEKQIGMARVRHKLAFWLLRAGTAVVWNLWDHDEGPEAMEGGTNGSPYSDVHPPHESFFYPVSATDMASADGIGRELRMSRAAAVLKFPDMAKTAASASSIDQVVGFDTTRLLRDFQPGRPGWLSQEGVVTATPFFRLDDEEVILIEFMLKPGAALMDGRDNRIYRFKRGLRLVMTTAGDVVHFGDNQYNRLPATRIAYTEAPGFWADAPNTPLRPIQMAINWAYSLFEENMVLAGRPILLWPRQARAAWRRLQDLTTRVLRFSPGPNGQNPDYLKQPNFPAQLPELLKILMEIWQDIAGLHEVSRGQLPAAGISGVAIQLLQDQDDSQIGFSVNQLEDGLADIVEQHLANYQRFAPMPMLLDAAGGSLHEARVFQGVDLQPGLGVQVQRGSALPKSPAATEAKAKDLWAQGALVDEFGTPDYRRMLMVTGLGDEDALYNEQQQDKNNAAVEEDFILGLQPQEAMIAIAFYAQAGVLPSELMPKPYDDHIVHEYRHRNLLKELREHVTTGERDVDPNNLKLLEIHWSLTLPLMQQQRMGIPPMPGFGQGTGTMPPQAMGAPAPGPGSSGPQGGKPAVQPPNAAAA